MFKQPTFFSTESDFRRWLAANHKTAPELLVGFWKKGSGKPSIDWPQARDQALCFGWIDRLRLGWAPAFAGVRNESKRVLSAVLQVPLRRQGPRPGLAL